jgi:hypothetical protein
VKGEIVCQQAMIDAPSLENLYFQYVERSPLGDLSWIG